MSNRRSLRHGSVSLRAWDSGRSPQLLRACAGHRRPQRDRHALDARVRRQEGRRQEAPARARGADRGAAGAALRGGPQRRHAQRADRAAGHGHVGQGRHGRSTWSARSTRPACASSRSAARRARSSRTSSSGASARELPEPGMLAVFDRSHYEDVVAVRVRGARREAHLGAALLDDQPLRGAARGRAARWSSSASCTSPPRSSASGFWRGSTTLPSTGSTAPGTSKTARSGAPSRRPTPTRSSAATPMRRPGTSFRPIASGIATGRSAACWSSGSSSSGWAGPRRISTLRGQKAQLWARRCSARQAAQKRTLKRRAACAPNAMSTCHSRARSPEASVPGARSSVARSALDGDASGGRRSRPARSSRGRRLKKTDRR